MQKDAKAGMHRDQKKTKKQVNESAEDAAAPDRRPRRSGLRQRKDRSLIAWWPVHSRDPGLSLYRSRANYNLSRMVTLCNPISIMSQIVSSRASDYKIWRCVSRSTASGGRPEEGDGGEGWGKKGRGYSQVWEMYGKRVSLRFYSVCVFIHTHAWNDCYSLKLQNYFHLWMELYFQVIYAPFSWTCNQLIYFYTVYD